jgi:hypothetical protein
MNSLYQKSLLDEAVSNCSFNLIISLVYTVRRKELQLFTIYFKDKLMPKDEELWRDEMLAAADLIFKPKD